MSKKKTITPSEINKFVYCNYQWYYEKKYGRKKLRELYKRKNERLNLKNELKSNFNKGNKFHEEFEIYKTENKMSRLSRYILIGIVIFLIVLLIIRLLT